MGHEFTKKVSSEKRIRGSQKLPIITGIHPDIPDFHFQISLPEGNTFDCYWLLGDQLVYSHVGSYRLPVWAWFSKIPWVTFFQSSLLVASPTKKYHARY